jgi:hypothetical protein
MSSRISLRHVEHGQGIYDGALTEPTLLDLLCSQRKHRKQFSHYFYNDLRHYGSERNRRIYLQALNESAQALEQLEKSIVT